MLTESFLSIADAGRQLWRNRSAMIFLAALYAGLIVCLYFFVTIREASARQVALTLALAIAAPVLFFLLQTTSARQTTSPALRDLVKESIVGCWKVVVVSLPLIAVAIFGFYLLARAQSYFGANADDLSQVAQQYTLGQESKTEPVKWSVVAFSAIRYVLIGALLPLALIHLWIAAVHEGLVSAARKTKALMARAYSPQSVLIYMAGFLVFGVIPYLLLFKAIPASPAWLEFSLFLARIIVVFVLTLFGWVVTMSALANSANPARNETTTPEV